MFWPLLLLKVFPFPFAKDDADEGLFLPFPFLCLYLFLFLFLFCWWHVILLNHVVATWPWCLLDVAVGEEVVDQQPDVLPRSERFGVDEQVLTDGAAKMIHHRREFKMVVDDHARFTFIAGYFFHPRSKLMMLMLFWPFRGQDVLQQGVGAEPMTSTITKSEKSPGFETIFILMETTDVVIWLWACLGWVHQDVAEIVWFLLDLAKLNIKVGLMNGNITVEGSDVSVDNCIISMMSKIIKLLL